MNEVSSRSHSVLTITIVREIAMTADEDDAGDSDLTMEINELLDGGDGAEEKEESKELEE